MARLFISHSSRNNDKAIEVRDWLARNGWDDVFLDLDPERGIIAGQRWNDALQKAAQHCEIVLALISAEWLASPWCKAEIDAARLMGKKVIVALIGVEKAQVPPDLNDEQWIDLTSDPYAYTRLREGLRRGGLVPSSFLFEAGRRPYPGFAFFEEKDAAIFFGRDAQIVRGLDKIRSLVRAGVDRMLVILGASGSGKSSFFRAGLWPRLKRDDRAWLPLPTIRPERAVISGTYGLAQALQQAMSEPLFADEIRKRGLPRSRAEIQDFIEKTEGGLVKIFAALRDIAHVPGFSGEATPPPTIVLAVDQGEDLFNDDGRDEARDFIEILAGALKTDPHMLVILIMRSDSFPQLQTEARLAELPKDTFTLDMMLEGSYRAVIEGPARLVQPTPIKIDPQLTDALLQDVSGQDALPLLAFTLAHLYEKYAADNELNLAEYEKLGRLEGVIATTVREAFAEGVAKGELPKDAKAQLVLVRKAFLPHLVKINPAGQFARRIATQAEIPAEARPLIDRFAERRLLIRDRRKIAGEDVEVIEVAHEAIFRHWDKLRELIAAEREFLDWRSSLEAARRDWQATPDAAKDEALLMGLALAQGQSWLAKRAEDLLKLDREFIVASVEKGARDVPFATPGGRQTGSGILEPRDEVHLGASVPPVVSAGETFVARFAAYTSANREKITTLIEREAPSAQLRLDLDQCQWRQGTEVSVRLECSNAMVSNPVQNFRWDGCYKILRFDVVASESVSSDTLILKFDVAVEGFPIVALRPEINVKNKDKYQSAPTSVSLFEMKAPRSAFASYVTSDLPGGAEPHPFVADLYRHRRVLGLLVHPPRGAVEAEVAR
jgi:hypothetical protein